MERRFTEIREKIEAGGNSSVKEEKYSSMKQRIRSKSRLSIDVVQIEEDYNRM